MGIGHKSLPVVEMRQECIPVFLSHTYLALNLHSSSWDEGVSFQISLVPDLSAGPYRTWCTAHPKPNKNFQGAY